MRKKKKWILIPGLALLALGISSSVLAIQDNTSGSTEASVVQNNKEQVKDPYTDAFHKKTLNNLNLHSKNNKGLLKESASDGIYLQALTEFAEENGETWTYASFGSPQIENIIKDQYGMKSSSSFLAAQWDTLKEIRQEGDTLPLVLVNKDLSKAQLAFLRNEGKGETLVVNIKLDKETKLWHVEN